MSRFTYVAMAALDPINRACVYAFPTPGAAERFAAWHQARHPRRVIVVRRPS